MAGLLTSLVRASAVPAAPGLVAGLYYGNDSQGNVAGYSTSVLVGGNIYAVWCPLPPEGAAIDRIGAEVTTISAGKSFRVAAYRPDGARRRPGSLIVDSGNLSAGAAAFVEATVAAYLPGGGVWLAINAEDGVMAFRIVGATSRIAVVGRSAGGGTNAFGSIVVAQAFGAFPATFPAGATPNGNAPVIQVRAA